MARGVCRELFSFEYIFGRMHHNKKRKGAIDTSCSLLLTKIKNKSRAIRLLYLTLGAFVVITLVRSFCDGEYFNAFVCFLTLGLFVLPPLSQSLLGLCFPDLFEGLVLLFIFATEILGEIYCFYQRVPHWDTALHTVSGFLLAALGFAMVELVNRDAGARRRVAPLCVATVAICFSMTVGVLWEFFEFGCDALLHTDMQKDAYVGEIYTVLLDEAKSNTVVPVRNVQRVVLYCRDGEGQACEVVLDGYIDIGLLDTMKDLAANFVGAAVFGAVGYFHVRHRKKDGLVSRLIPTLKE